MIINLSGDDDDDVWVCGVCGDGVCVCSLHYTVVMMALYIFIWVWYA